MPLAIKPENIVDRDDELGIFKQLLQFANEARLLTIEDGEGTGKTELLKKLWHHCRRKIPPQPVSRVLLDEIKSDDPFLFVTSIHEELEGLDFPTFKELNAALVDKNFAPFAGQGQSRLDARGATVSGQNNRFADTYQEGETINNNYYAPREWDSDRELVARKACTRAFFSDLKQVAAEKSVVILFDSYDDRCNSKLYDLIWNELITPSFDPEKRPDRLVLVIAGRELPDIPPEYSQLMFSRESLGWTEEHLRDFLVVHGVPDLTDYEFGIVWGRVKQGAAILKALGLAEAIRNTRT